MGVKINEYRLLKILHEQIGNYGDVLTLGKQKIYFEHEDLDSVNNKHEWLDTLLLSQFGAKTVDSLDYSDYEGASIIHDLSKDVPVELVKKYDLVIDFGTSEHIFDIKKSFENCVKMVRQSGWLVHALPSNNANGHGFFQISPELFFSLYSRENGFSDTQVYVVDTSKNGRWYELSPPIPGERLNIISRNETYIFCITKVISHKDQYAVFQSDYVDYWATNERPLKNKTNPKFVIAIWKSKRLLLKFPLAMSLREGYFKKFGIIHQASNVAKLIEVKFKGTEKVH